MSLLMGKWKHAVLIIVLSVYTAFAAGPLFWVSLMSLRTTSEIAHNPYAFPEKLHIDKFSEAWINSNYSGGPDTFGFNDVLDAVGNAVQRPTPVSRGDLGFGLLRFFSSGISRQREKC